MGQVRTTFTSEDKDVQQALDRMTKNLQKVTEENRKLKDQSRQTRDETKNMFAEAERGAERWAGGLNLVAGAMQAVNTELERARRLQADAARAQLGQAGSQSDLLNNLGNVPRAEMDRITGGARAIARRTGVPVDAINLATSQALSARGELSTMQAMDFVEMAARTTKEPGQISALAGAFLDVASLTQSDQPGQNAAFLQVMQSQTRIANPIQIAQNLVPGAIGASKRGATPAEAAALMTTMSFALKDQSGAISASTGFKLADELQRLVPGANFGERFEAVANDPARLRAFLAESQFEQKGRPGVEAIFGELRPLFRSNVQAYGPATAQDFERFLGNKAQVAGQSLQSTQGRLASALEGGQLGEELGQRTAVIREALSQALDESGASDFPVLGRKGWLMRAFNERVEGGLGTLWNRSSPEDAAIAVLEARKGQLGVGPAADEKLDVVIDELRGIRANQRVVNPEAHRE